MASHPFSWSKVWKKDHRLGYYEWPAYLFDIYRVAPRLLFGTATWYVYHIGEWYMRLPAMERTTEVSAFVAIIIGAWVKALDYYMQRGVDWSKRMQINGGESSGTNTSISG